MRLRETRSDDVEEDRIPLFFSPLSLLRFSLLPIRGPGRAEDGGKGGHGWLVSVRARAREAERRKREREKIVDGVFSLAFKAKK